MSKWERLTNRIGSSPIQRLEANHCLDLFPPACGETALDMAAGYAAGLPRQRDERLVSSFLLLSLCATLDISGRVAPEEVDKVIQTLTTSTKPKYLDKLKRGARVANEIIAEWAKRGGGDRLHRLDQATQAILQGRCYIMRIFTPSCPLTVHLPQRTSLYRNGQY